MYHLFAVLVKGSGYKEEPKIEIKTKYMVNEQNLDYIES